LIGWKENKIIIEKTIKTNEFNEDVIMGKTIAVIGTIVTVISWLILSIYSSGIDFTSGLGTIEWLFLDINFLFEGTVEWAFLICEIIILLGIIFMIVGIWKRKLGIIGSIILTAFTIFALLGIFGIGIPVDYNILWYAMTPTGALLPGILPFHLEIMNGYGLGAILVPVGAIVTLIGQIMNKKK
jgi:hypothetical protein